MDNLLENSIIYLIRNERFYAEMLHRMIKTSTTEIDTLGVVVTTKGVELKINPYFFDNLPVVEQAEVLKHECEHPMRDLVYGSDREKSMAPDLYKDGKEDSFIDRYKKMSTSYLVNIAEDLAINETLPNLPKKVKIFDKEGKCVIDPETGKEVEGALCFVDDLIKMFPEENIQRNQATEYYYSFLKQKKEEGKFKGKNGDGEIIITIDDHQVLNESAEKIDPKFAKAIMQKLVNDAKESTPGKLPGHIEVLIDKLNKSTHDWRKDLRMFRAACTSVTKVSTRKRRNRRYGLLYPGKKRNVRLHLVAVVDSSGSVWQKALNQFYSEFEPMADEGVDITVIECDAQVQQVFKYDSKRVPKAKGRGGTSFEPAFNLVKTNEFINEYGQPDGLIYFTDGEDWGKVEEPDFPVLWALLPKCKSRYTWGRTTTVEVID